MSRPLISIIVPCYNQAEYLDECLQSVLDQTYQNWECIIVNDGSPDNTEEVAKLWLKKDFRFKYFFQDNKGVSAARNNGIKNAKGEWILPLDGDDKIGNLYLELGAKKFSEDTDIVYCHAEYFGTKSGKMMLDDYNQEDILLENQIFCTSFYQKKTWLTVGGYDESMLSGYEDWEFWINMFAFHSSLNIIRLDYTGFYYRIKEQSRNIDAMHKNDKSIRKYIFTKHFDIYRKNISSFYNYFATARTLKMQNAHLIKRLNSKRYQLIDKVFSIFNR